MTPPLDRLWKAPVRPGLSLSLVHCSLGEAQLWRGQAPFGREGLPTSAATPSALYLPPEQHAALPASAAVTAVTGYSSIAHYFLDGRFARHGLELGLSWSCRFTHRVAPWQVLTRRVAVVGRGASMIRLFGGLTTEQKYPVLLEYAKASFERIKQRLRHL